MEQSASRRGALLLLKQINGGVAVYRKSAKRVAYALGVTMTLAMLFLVGCNMMDALAGNGLELVEVVLPYSCNGVANVPRNLTVRYLPFESPDNNKIVLKFNKELSDKYASNLYFIQKNFPIPILPYGATMPLGREYHRYRITGRTLEIVSRSAHFANPMMFSALFIPKGLMAMDGGILPNDLGLFFSLDIPSPNEEIRSVNASLPGSPATVIIPMYSEEGSLWCHSDYKPRRVGYIADMTATIYSDKAMTRQCDTLSLGSNVQIIKKLDHCYEVHYYVPHTPEHSRQEGTSALDFDVLKSTFVTKKHGYVKTDQVGIVERFTNQGVRLTVFATEAFTMNGELELYVACQFYPLGGASYRLYSLAEGSYQPCNIPKVITSHQINALEVASYWSVYEMFGEGHRTWDEAGTPIPLEDQRLHRVLLSEFPNDREYVTRLVDQYSDYIIRTWKTSVGRQAGMEYEGKFSRLLEDYRKLNALWYRWSETDPELSKSTYVQLMIESFGHDETARKKISDCFADPGGSMFAAINKFVKEHMWAGLLDVNVAQYVERAFAP